ncbi:MAG: hypothetical protein PHQ91_02035 [Thermoanaerobaculaceae bacterium]|nr:hypothetical protein [Thermoanaerobaculaceae bacterium]
MMVGLRLRFGGQAGLWLAGVVFAVAGLVILVAAPASSPWGPDRDTDRLVMRILGGLFLAFGVLIIAGMTAGLVAAGRRPGAREEWSGWVNLLGGLLGAAAFGVPATLALPFYLAAYRRRPNALFPPGTPPSHTLLLAGAFSLMGLGTLVLTAVLARVAIRARLRERRRAARTRTGDAR